MYGVYATRRQYTVHDLRLDLVPRPAARGGGRLSWWSTWPTAST